MRLLITGGAGFVGSSLALAFKRDRPRDHVAVLDTLRRRGSELNLERLRQAGVAFLHGDVRSPGDLAAAGPFDCLIDCAAEPSVQAGYGGGGPAYVVETNLIGSYHCLEAARQHQAMVVFLSTSRVYPVAALRALPLTAAGDRLALTSGAHGIGWSERGIGLDFPLTGSRSLYGASKLASEHLVEEYAALYDLPAVIDRCGVLAGPWQMGKVDQGFLSLWAGRHLFGGPLSYIGFGGLGHQVRDVLHVDDLYDLLRRQMTAARPGHCALFNVGGGPANAVSLRELTAHCQSRSGAALAIGSRPDTHPADIPWYVSDIDAVVQATGWQPRRSVGDIVEDTFNWLETHRSVLEPQFAGAL